ncbi:MAG: LSU ribosomal protein L9p [Rhodanobacteraceae bacterium]|jgi:large subunit ribosomal protein L9|nr:MAG: LSU ribosomal protein L9p [Rhodanobacteraceae bacterium]
MEVILLEKVKNLGALGDKVRVKPGYGRNYLVPQGKAVPASKANLEQFEAKRAEYQAKADKLLADAQARGAKFENAEATITANASPEGKLFGSVGPRDIAEAFSAQGLALEKSEVIMPEGAIHNVGEYAVEVSLHADVKVPVKVRVTAGA